METNHLMAFKIQIGGKSFNSLLDLDYYVAGIAATSDSSRGLETFLLEYAQLKGIIEIGEKEPNLPDQKEWFKIPLKYGFYDFTCIEIKYGKIILHGIQDENIELTTQSVTIFSLETRKVEMQS